VKSEKIKKISFLLLLIAAIFIWARNLDIFRSQPAYFQLKKAPQKKAAGIVSKIDKIEYQKPPINPFSINEFKAISGGGQKEKEVAPAMPERLSGRYIIDGLVPLTARPQAILRELSGGNRLISVDDSISGWKVISIDGRQAVLSSGRYRDTLRLPSK
jgi:hypothetical protein